MLASLHTTHLGSGISGNKVVTRTRISSRTFSTRPETRRVHRIRRQGRCTLRPRAASEESFLDKINPFKKSKGELAKREKEQENALINDETRKQFFGDGLMGKAISGLINNAASGLKEQMSVAAEASAVTYDSAVRACRIDSRIRNALGSDFTATPPMSQMSSSTSINGVSATQTTVGFLLQSSSARRAQVQAVSTTANGVTTVDATIAMDGGEQFTIKDCAGGADAVMADDGNFSSGGSGGGQASGGYSNAGATIDIDADDVIDV